MLISSKMWVNPLFLLLVEMTNVIFMPVVVALVVVRKAWVVVALAVVDILPAWSVVYMEQLVDRMVAVGKVRSLVVVVQTSGFA